MSVPTFVDTNVLLYARDASEPEKQPLARRWLDVLWEHRTGRLSYQVLNEYYVAATRKLRPGLEQSLARADVQDLMAWRPIVLDEAMVKDAWHLEDRFGLSYRDALIVAAAREAGCDQLLTEDLQHGQDLDGVTVIDPFTNAPGELT